MAGGLGGLGGFGNVLQALGQSLLTSPSGNPFETLPANMQAVQQQREHWASLNAMSQVAKQLGIPEEIAANPDAMALLIQQMNTTKLNALRQQAAAGGSLMPPSGDSAQPAMAVPPPQTGGGGLGGLGGRTAPSFGLTGPIGAPSTPAPSSARSLPTFAQGRIPDLLASSAQQYGQDPSVVTRIAQIESSLNPSAKNPNSSAGGLGQFIDSTWAAYGRGKSKFDPAANADALARLTKDNAGALREALGRGPTPGEIYLAHQQGLGGAIKLLSNPGARAVDLVGERAVRLNGGNSSMTAGQFASLWDKKMGMGGGPSQSTQVASNDTASPAMQRVQDEARAKGIGQTEPAPYQVAASSKSIPVPIPQTSIPATPPPPAGASENKTQAWGRGELQRGFNILATSNGDPVLMKQAELIIQRAAKYADPSDTAKRVGEAGLTGTPIGRAIIAGMPGGVQEKLAEQLVPGYEAPGTLAQKEFANKQDQQAWERVQKEREMAQRERLATMTEQEKLGAATLRAPGLVQAGQAARTEQAGSEATARDTAAATIRFKEQATSAAQAAQTVMPAIGQARAAYEDAVKHGGTGFFGASPAARLGGQAFSTRAEAAREKFDNAVAAINMAKSAVSLKGQGPVSNFERELAAADLPSLRSTDPKTARDAFDRLQGNLDRALELDKRMGLFGGAQNEATPRTDLPRSGRLRFDQNGNLVQ